MLVQSRGLGAGCKFINRERCKSINFANTAFYLFNEFGVSTFIAGLDILELSREDERRRPDPAACASRGAAHTHGFVGSFTIGRDVTSVIVASRRAATHGPWCCALCCPRMQRTRHPRPRPHRRGAQATLSDFAKATSSGHTPLGSARWSLPTSCFRCSTSATMHCRVKSTVVSAAL